MSELNTFRKVLLHHGFKREKQHHAGIVPYAKGKMYCEVYNDRIKWCWAAGGDLKDEGFPGGADYFSPDELRQELDRVSNRNTGRTNEHQSSKGKTH